MRYLFTRQIDGATFEVGDFATPYVLSPDTVEPNGGELDTSGYEYSGIDGGYTTASRYQRGTLDLVFTILEMWSSPKRLLQLIAEANAFFDPHDDDLGALLYDIEIQTCSGSYLVRNGTISVPLTTSTNRAERSANALISFIFGDPYRYHVNGAGVISVALSPYSPIGDAYGREWSSANGATWEVGANKTWVVPSSGIPGEPVTAYLISEKTVKTALSLAGELTNPTLKNLTDGSEFNYNGVIPAGSTLTVDPAGNVLLNGVPAPGTWSGVLTARGGYNTFLLEAAGSNGGSAQLTIAGAF